MLVSAGLWGTRLPGGAGGAQWAAVPTRTPLKRFPPCSGLGSGGSHETVSPSLRSQRAPSEGRVRRQRRDGGRRWEDGTKPCRRFENCHCKIWGNRSGFQAGRPPAEEERGLGGVEAGLRSTRRRPGPALGDVTFIFEKGKKEGRPAKAFGRFSSHQCARRVCEPKLTRTHTRAHPWPCRDAGA